MMRDSDPSRPAVPTVFVVDDDVSVRESLELLIECAGWRPATFESALDFLSQPRLATPSCLVLDVSLPDLDGLELQKQLAEREETPIVFLTAYGNVPRTVQAMKNGAVDFLTKPFSDEALLSALRHAIERSRIHLENEAATRPLRDAYASLTRREREVLALVFAGLLNKQIAGRLGISETTVKAHRGQVMRKMNATTTADLVYLTTRLGLTPEPKA